MISIQRARIQDAPRMHQLQLRAFQEEGRRCGTMDIPPLTESADAIADHVREQIALIAVLDGAIVGCIRGILEGGSCTIRGLVVDPARQGQGIGSRLLLALEQGLTGVARIDLTTNTLMERNELFYRSHGYQVTSYSLHGPGIRLVHMSKSAASSN